MNPSFSKSNPAAEETAALWAARLDGSELSASDRAELDEWLAADPAHRGLLSGYCQFSADLERPLASLVESGAVQMPGAAASASSQKRSRLKLFTGSALAAIAAAIMFAVWIAQPQTQFNEIATAISLNCVWGCAIQTANMMAAAMAARAEPVNSLSRERF